MCIEAQLRYSWAFLLPFEKNALLKKNKFLA